VASAFSVYFSPLASANPSSPNGVGLSARLQGRSLVLPALRFLCRGSPDSSGDVVECAPIVSAFSDPKLPLGISPPVLVSTSCSSLSSHTPPFVLPVTLAIFFFPLQSFPSDSREQTGDVSSFFVAVVSSVSRSTPLNFSLPAVSDCSGVSAAVILVSPRQRWQSGPSPPPEFLLVECLRCRLECCSTLRRRAFLSCRTRATPPFFPVSYLSERFVVLPKSFSLTPGVGPPMSRSLLFEIFCVCNRSLPFSNR